MVAQATAELALAGDPRQVEVLRLAAEPGPVRLWGGAQVRPDALYRDEPGLDVLVLVGPAEGAGSSARDEEAAIGFAARARPHVQHVIATGQGVRWLLEGGLAAGRRVVLNQIAPATRARFDAALPAHTDPARDGDLWSASDPPRFLLLLLEFFADLGGFRLPDRIQMRMPWVAAIREACMPSHVASEEDEDDEGGIPIEKDVEP
jgi:transcriptional regulator GlxA family with amidase domain